MAWQVKNIEQLLAPSITALGFEMWGVLLLSQGRHSVLRVFIDSPDGITVDDCATVSRQLSAVLDVEDPIRGDYTLEVSSPGLDRPLFTPAQVERYCGQTVSVRLRQMVSGRRKFQGVVTRVESDGSIALDLGGEDELSFTMEEADRVHLVPQW
ncbi:ribosome maturation factor RimP [Ectothiorhodospiraceae bacterium BW-2]|nr:ribosome maturation factor RimP [Ectothiorhodospiraceae bacterium BW-2]